MANLSDYFNNKTIRGRANIAKLTYASIAGIYIYYRYIRNKPKSSPEQDQQLDVNAHKSNANAYANANGNAKANGNGKSEHNGHETVPHNGDVKTSAPPCTCPPDPCLPPPVKCENIRKNPQISANGNDDTNESLKRSLLRDYENILIWSPW